jgi:hypothetical protein
MMALRYGRCRPVAALLLVLHLGACTTWSLVTVSPQQLIEEDHPDRVRVWHDGQATEFLDPRIDGNAITSTIPTELGRIPLTDITFMEVNEFSSNRTFLLGMVPIITVVLVCCVKY